MEAVYNTENREYKVKEKMSNGQTFLMTFSDLLDDSLDTVYYNVCISVHNKRKHAYQNEVEKRITGASPFESAILAMKAFDLLEKEVIARGERIGKRIVVVINWSDNRRRDVYYKFLSKRGYQYKIMWGEKCIAKTVCQ